MAEYIERGSALKEIDQSYGLYEASLRVSGIPTADVTPVRHSRWVHCFQQDGETVGQCYECHAIRFVDTYCPNCGAKMDLEG